MMLLTIKDFLEPEIVVFVIPVVALLGAFTVAIMKVFAKEKSKQSLNELKQSMVERGMSVDEIERVLKADSKPEKKD